MDGNHRNSTSAKSVTSENTRNINSFYMNPFWQSLKMKFESRNDSIIQKTCVQYYLWMLWNTLGQWFDNWYCKCGEVVQWLNFSIPVRSYSEKIGFEWRQQSSSLVYLHLIMIDICQGNRQCFSDCFLNEIKIWIEI